MRKFVITQQLTNRNSISIENYLKELSKYPILSIEEETELLTKSINGDISARNKLVEHNLRFVVSVAKGYKTHHENLNDLINEGNIGLMIAAEKFDLSKKVKFISYAVWWIRKKITQFITENGRTISLPADKINDLAILDKQVNALEQKLGRPVTIDEVINEFGEDFAISKYNNKYKKTDKLEKDYKILANIATQQIESLDKKLDEDDSSSISVGDLITCDYFQNGEHLLEDKESKKLLLTLINTLKDREKDIITKYFGLSDNIPRTMDDLGEEYNLSREMIRQIKDKSLKKLRRKLLTNTI